VVCEPSMTNPDALMITLFQVMIFGHLSHSIRLRWGICHPQSG
jgi:hypothetical protein